MFAAVVVAGVGLANCVASTYYSSLTTNTARLAYCCVSYINENEQRHHLHLARRTEFSSIVSRNSLLLFWMVRTFSTLRLCPVFQLFDNWIWFVKIKHSQKLISAQYSSIFRPRRYRFNYAEISCINPRILNGDVSRKINLKLTSIH